jgi:Holliday junction DNA helicase RuvA
MIALLEGIVVEHEADAVILNVNGVGYRVFSTRPTVEVGERLRLFISEVIRDDRHDLYGFASKEERELFVLLTNVQGVGPRIGQKILAAATANKLRSYIQAGDLNFFTSIGGIGKKTGQKIILELKGVLVSGDAADATQDEISSVLMGLGYSRQDVQEVLPHVTGSTEEDRLKSALKMLGR